MNALRQALLLSILAIGVGLVACHQVTGYPPVGATTSGPTDDRALVVVTYVKDVDDILKVCPRTNETLYGCARLDSSIDPPICRVTLQEPADFNDEARLAVLGHEVWHCLGAQHEGQ